MGVGTVLTTYCLGAAVLALWIAVRFPSLGPTRPADAILAVVASYVLLSLALPGMELVAGVGRHGALLALLLVVLPALTAAFLACVWLLRLLAGLRPG